MYFYRALLFLELGNQDAAVQDAALAAAVKLPRNLISDRTKVLAVALGSARDDLRTRAVIALGDAGYEADDAAAILAACMNDGSPLVRFEAACEIARLAEAVGADVCSVYLNDYDNRRHILQATDGLRPEAVGRFVGQRRA